MTSSSLPAAPRLEQLRKQAKDLLRAHRAGDPTAHARVAAQLERSPGSSPAALPPDAAPGSPRAASPGSSPVPPLKLSGAQLTVAREHGFGSWARLRAYVERREAGGPALQHAFQPDLDYYDARALGLLASAEDGTPGAVAAFARHGLSVDRRGARIAVARQHGFPSWSALRRHVASLDESGEPFARAYRAVEAVDPDALRALLDRFPELATARGTNGNDLLGMATATGDEPLVRLLLERGADPAAANVHGWTALHQTGYGGRRALARILLDAGASPATSARGDGGTPLVVALFWGHRETAELLAEHDLAPANLRVAAGLGRLDLLEALVAADGTLRPAAGAHRAFYRPHGGFPAWAATDDPRETRDEALAWAARNGRDEAIAWLVDHGAALDADVYRGTALTWAAFRGRVATVERLLALGADPDRRASFGGPDHGEGVTALHLAAQQGQRTAVEALLRGGADPSLRDALHDSTPEGWATFGGHPAVAERLTEGPRPWR